MAIRPGDSRIPRYREGTAEPIFRKQSPSQAVCLYLSNRDVWSNLYEVYQRKKVSGKERFELPECGGAPYPAATKDYKPSHHGIIEGIVHVNPWLIKLGSYVFVEVISRYRYTRSDLDAFDCEIDEVVFKQSRQINPPKGYDLNAREAMRNPSDDLDNYSYQTRMLYDKLGGPVSGQAMRDEVLTSCGVLVGTANNTRKNRTFVPQTKATAGSGYPDHPYVTYKFPFRFDVNGTPDSVYLKGVPTPTRDGETPPPNRMQLFYDAVFGFGHQLSDSDPDSPSETDNSDDDEILKNRIRHPGEPIIKPKNKPSKEKKKRQWEKDLFHPDSYPWLPRPKRVPRDGISWVIRAYVAETQSSKPKSEHIAVMRIRKLSYVPRIIPIEHMEPPTSKTDYCLAIGPRTGHDAGVITLLAKLDKILYAPGEPVQCDVKIHNSSVRLIHRLVVEVHQCLRTKALATRVWRSVICRRCINDLSVHGGMPVLPGNENVRIRVTLNPWPTVKSIQEALEKCQGPLKPSGLQGLDEAWAIRLPKVPGQNYALETPGRHEPVPPQHIQRRALAVSTFSGVYERLLSIGEEITLLKPLEQDEKIKNIWQGDPHEKCRCVHKWKPGDPKRTSHMPPNEPYQVPIESKDVYPQDEEVCERRARQNMLQPYCQKCSKLATLRDYPIQVSYEVVVQAELLPQHCPNPLAAESAIRESGLGSGLLIDPYGDIIGPDGPRVLLPCFLGYKGPKPEEAVPIANYRVDQRQNYNDNVIREPKVYEPSLGKGFFVSKTYPVAPCSNS